MNISKLLGIFSPGFKSSVSTVYLTAGITDTGLVRKNNEDSFIVTEAVRKQGENLLFCAVADGMGGQEYGEEASTAAVETLRSEYTEIVRWRRLKKRNWSEWLQAAVHKANTSVLQRSDEVKCKGFMGTTVVAALIAGGRAYIANVGDSRAYILRDKELQLLTRDHSLVALMLEQEVIQPDEMYTHPRRNEIMRFLGQRKDVEADIFELELKAEDKIILCSDGLWSMVRDEDLRAILSSTNTPEESCQKLINAAKSRGGEDNITIIVINAYRHK